MVGTHYCNRWGTHVCVHGWPLPTLKLDTCVSTNNSRKPSPVPPASYLGQSRLARGQNSYKQLSYSTDFKHISSSYYHSSKGQAWMEKSRSPWSLKDQAAGNSAFTDKVLLYSPGRPELVEVLQAQPPTCWDYRRQDPHLSIHLHRVGLLLLGKQGKASSEPLIPALQEAKAGAFGFQSQHQLHIKFKASLGYLRPCLKQTTKAKHMLAFSVTVLIKSHSQT